MMYQGKENGDCKCVVGSWLMHCVNGYSTTNKCVLRSKKLSCFCYSCMSQCWGRCSNATHVDGWKYHQLVPRDIKEDSEEDAINQEVEYYPLYAGHHDNLSDSLCVGDNFATNPTEKDVDFYILKCTRAKYKTTKACRDGGRKDKDQNHQIDSSYCLRF